MAFSEQLVALRRKNNLTQEQFAESLQVSRQAVSKWESGRGYPEIEKIIYICNRYHISLDEMFAEEVPTEHSEKTVQMLEERTLHKSLSSFFNNLSPKNKWLGAGVLLGVAILAALIALCLKGGNSGMTIATMIWIGVIVVFGVMEAATAGLTSIWFVLGGIAGLLAAVCGGSIWLQVVLFFVVSIVALIATRPLVRKLTQKNLTATNADRVVGETARVTEKIDNAVPQGAVYADGKTWSARSVDGAIISEQTMVKVVRMEGVKLFVEKL